MSRSDKASREAQPLITSVFQHRDVEDAWADEVERRVEAVESSPGQLIPAAEAIARARAAIK